MLFTHLLPLAASLHLQRSPPPINGRACPPAMALLGQGEQCPPSVLAALGAEGKRCITAFIMEDTSFNCAKHLLALSEFSDEFAARSCSIIAVQSTEPKKPEMHPSIRFLADDTLRGAMGLKDGRATFLLEANGTVCGSVSNAVEASAHAVYALRLLKALDESIAAEEAAMRAAMTKGFSFVQPTAEEVVEEEQVDAANAQAALRMQSMRAEANRNVKFSFGRKTLKGEAQRLASRAAEQLEAARAEEAVLRAEVLRGDDGVVDAALQAKVDKATEAVNRAREDEMAALQIEYDAVTEELVGVRLGMEMEACYAKDAARRAYGYRRDATKAMLGIEEASERTKMSQALESWSKKQQADQRIADGDRKAVEAAWARTQGDESGAEEAASRWAAQLSLVDPSEVPQLDDGPKFDSVSEQASYSFASLIAAKAEKEEAEAQKWAFKVSSTLRREEEVLEELEKLEVRMGRRAAVEERRKVADADEGVEGLRAALELAMLRTAAANEEEVVVVVEAVKEEVAEEEEEAVEEEAESSSNAMRIAELEAQIAALKAKTEDSE